MMFEPSGLMFLILMPILFLLSIVAHEMGHYFIMKQYVNKVKFSFYYNSWRTFGIQIGEDKDYIFLTRDQKIEIGLTGIFSGFAFIFLTGYLNQAFLLIVVPYLFGCETDYRIIRELIKEKNDN